MWVGRRLSTPRVTAKLRKGSDYRQQRGGGAGKYLPHFLFSDVKAGNMQQTKFLVKLDRGATRVPQYVQRVDPAPIQTTTDLELALITGRLTAEDTVKSMQNTRCSPEMVPVRTYVFPPKGA
jgi:hypothetical protein